MNKEVEKSEEQTKEVPSCVSFLGYWRRCTSATNHFHNYYVYGEFPSCQKEKENIKNCFKYKATKDKELEEKVLQAVKENEDRENFVNKPSSSVWELRENPGDDWLKQD